MMPFQDYIKQRTPSADMRASISQSTRNLWKRDRRGSSVGPRSAGRNGNPGICESVSRKICFGLFLMLGRTDHDENYIQNPVKNCSVHQVEADASMVGPEAQQEIRLETIRMYRSGDASTTYADNLKPLSDDVDVHRLIGEIIT